MEDKRQVFGFESSSSSTSLTMDLFGPKDTSSPSSGLFGSVFGPPSTGLQRDSSHTGPMRTKELGHQYGNGKQGNSGNSSHNQNKSTEPCYFSSSIYYGGQEVYSPTVHTTTPQHIQFKKDGGDDDANGSNSNSASRGNWWQGSLYY